MGLILLNSLLIVVCGSLGLLVRRFINTKKQEIMLDGLGLCVVYMGLKMAFEADNPPLIILSIVIGGLIGSGLNIQGLIDHWESKWMKKAGEEKSLLGPFIYTSLLFCAGSMAILGPMEVALQGESRTLMVKSILDATTAMIFASTMGIGVLLSAVPVLVIQGTFFYLAQFLQPFVTDVFMQDLTGVGGILVFAIGLNFLNIRKIPVSDYLPALGVLPILYYIIHGLGHFF